MIRQICNVKPQDTANIRFTELLARLGIEDLALILKERRLRLYGHVERSNGAVKTAFDIQIVGKHGPVRPKMTWKQLTERDCREWKLSAIDPHYRNTWRSGVRSAMWKGAHCCGYCPCTCTLINKRAMMALGRSPEYHWNQIISKSVHRFSRSRLKLFSIKSPGGHFVQQSGTV